MTQPSVLNLGIGFSQLFMQPGYDVAAQHKICVSASYVVMVVEQGANLVSMPNLVALEDQALARELRQQIVDAVNATPVGDARKMDVGRYEQELRVSTTLRTRPEPTVQLGSQLAEEPSLIG